MSCDDLHRFVDGELTPAEADAYRDHLAGCAACQAELPRVMALVALLETTADVDRGAAPIVEQAARRGGDVVPLRRSRRRVALAGALVVAAAAVAAIAIGRTRSRSRGPDAPAELALVGPTRPGVARFAYPGAADYRPYDPTRGAAGDPGRVPFATMAALEQRGDWHGLGVAALIQGERAQAARFLARAAPSPDVEADRAALALADGEDAGLADALAALDAVLAAHPDHAAAAWNRAQVLARLGLARIAAAEFDRLAARGEPGWSDEAKRTAASLRAATAAEQAGWDRDWAIGTRLVADGTLPAPGAAAARPGIFRLMFYDAVRAAPSAERIRALRPLALELDAAAGTGVLVALIDRVAATSFARRAPLAARYRAAAIGEATLDDTAAARLIDELRRAGAELDDVRLGALHLFGAVAAHPAEYDRLAAATGDPWFVALAAHHRALAALARGDRAGAAAILVPAIRDAAAARVDYRAAILELELANLDLELDRWPDAAELARAAFTRARAGGESGNARTALPVLGNVALRRFQLALASAYFEEEAAASPPAECATLHHAHYMLAQTMILRGDRARARAELALAPSCGGPPEPAALAVGVVLARQGGTADDAARLRADLAALRAAPDVRPADAMFADAFEGALVIERDEAAGEALLRQALARAELLDDAPATRPAARRVRAWSYALRSVAAAGRGDFAAVIGLLAEAKRIAPPARCTVAIAIESERLVVAGAGADGRVIGRFDRAWAYPDAAPPLTAGALAPVVPADVIAALAGCAAVDVLALAPIEGTPRLLPPALPWAYRVEPGAAPPAAVAPLRVRVSGVASPGALELAPLAPVVTPGDQVPVRDLTGAGATPSRVLAAIGDATEIELHTHGLRDRNHSDASYLVLSADPDGDYALTAARIAGIVLRGAPVVTVAACGGARGEPYLHQSDSLPAAFVRAGARAVMATPDDVPDDAATRFFAAVRARTAAGAELAAALRDERLDWLAHDAASWTQDVLLYR